MDAIACAGSKTVSRIFLFRHGGAMKKPTVNFHWVGHRHSPIFRQATGRDVMLQRR